MRNVHYSSSRVHPRGKKALIIILIITGIVLIALIVPQLIYRQYTGKEIGRTEDNPARIRTPVRIGDFTVMVKGIGYGDSTVENNTNWHVIPGKPYYFVQVNVIVTCNEAPSKGCSTSGFFALVDSSGTERDTGGVVMGKIPSHLKQGSIKGGESIEGDLFYLVPSAEKNFMLIFSPKHLWLEARSNCAFISLSLD